MSNVMSWVITDMGNISPRKYNNNSVVLTNFALIKMYNQEYNHQIKPCTCRENAKNSPCWSLWR